MKIADPRHPRHPGRIRGLRDARVGAVDAARPARPRGHRLLPARPDRRVHRRSRRASGAGSSPTCRASTWRPSATPACASSTACSAATTPCGSATPPTPSSLRCPRLRGTRVALNVDGIERQRAKWGPGRAGLVCGRRAVRARLPERDRLRRRGDPRLLPRALRQGVDASSRTARRCSTASPRPTWPATASTRTSSPGATSSTSAASSPRTRPTS